MLALWKKSYDQLRQHIKKQRHYFADKVCLVKAMVFPVVVYGCESWTIKKAEGQRIDAFFFLFFLKIILLYLLYNTILVLPYINMNPPWVYMSSQS